MKAVAEMVEAKLPEEAAREFKLGLLPVSLQVAEASANDGGQPIAETGNRKPNPRTTRQGARH